MPHEPRGPTYEEVPGLLREEFPEFWDEHLAWMAAPEGDGFLVHAALGAVANQACIAARAGDRGMAARIARLANILAESDDERVDNALHVSFLQCLDGLDRADLEAVVRDLSAKAEAGLHAMLPDILPYAHRPKPAKGKPRVARKINRRAGKFFKTEYNYFIAYYAFKLYTLFRGLCNCI